MKPAESTKRQYESTVHHYLVLTLAKAEGDWRDQGLVDEYISKLEATPPGDRRKATARWLQSYVLTQVRAKLGHATISWRYTVAKSFAEWVMEDSIPGWDSRAIRKSFAAFKNPDKVRPGLSREQLRDILHWLASPDTKAFVMVCKSSGGRPDEVANLRADDVDRRASPWKVTYRGVKEGGDRVSYVDRETEPHVDALIRTGDWAADPRLFKTLGADAPKVLEAVRKDWRRALKRLGMPYRDERTHQLVNKLYLLRSYFKTKAGAKDAMGREIAELIMGHHGDATEGAYQRYSEQEMRQAYDAGQSSLWCEALYQAPANKYGLQPGQSPPEADRSW